MTQPVNAVTLSRREDLAHSAEHLHPHKRWEDAIKFIITVRVTYEPLRTIHRTLSYFNPILTSHKIARHCCMLFSYLFLDLYVFYWFTELSLVYIHFSYQIHNISLQVFFSCSLSCAEMWNSTQIFAIMLLYKVICNTVILFLHKLESVGQMQAVF